MTFDPWKQTTHDANDTAKPGQRWYDLMKAGTGAEQAAADKTNLHADTPTVTYFDALARPVVVRAHNRLGPTLTDEFHETKSVLDVQGNLLQLIDARGIACMTLTHGMLGQLLKQVSTDAGSRWMLTTAAGQPVTFWGERGFTQRVAYDALRRPTKVFVHDGSTETLVERLYYGEDHPSAAAIAAGNLKGHLVAHFDQAGVVITDDFDFKGRPKSQRRQLAESWSTLVDYGALANENNPVTALGTAETNNLVHGIASETFTHAFLYDALDRPTSVTTPDGTEVLPTYNDAGLLETVAAKVRGASTTTTFVSAIDYDAKGRRASITYDEGNGSTTFATTSYSYDPYSFRLTHFNTTRGTDTLQDVTYTYDAVGNIVETVTDHDDVYFTSTPAVAGGGDYTYDAVYRLIEAKGREHAGTVADTQYDDKDVTVHTAHPNSASGLRAYTQKWTYDPTGNLTQWQHLAGISNAASWTRDYTYAPGTNRLATTSHTAGTKNYTHDAHGNIIAMPHLSAIDWDYADRMRHVAVTTGQDVYFNDDAAGQRVRKVWITNAGTWRRERIYLGGYEVWRKYNLVSGNWVLQDERETVHISDDSRRICMVETLTVEGGAAPSSITPRFRFQFDDHLGTACVETDETGAVISYEEYHPYGTSSYRSWKTGAEVSAKRYRYTGKERDEETSLYYHGARYYAPWLGRWMSADPAGTVDGTNLFAYVRGSPVVLSDPSGMAGSDEPNVPQTGIYGVGYEGYAEREAAREYQFPPAEVSGSYSQAVRNQAWVDRMRGKTDLEQQQKGAAEQAEVEQIADALARRDLAKWLTEDPKIQAREALGGLEPGHVAAVVGAPAALVMLGVVAGAVGSAAPEVWTAVAFAGATQSGGENDLANLNFIFLGGGAAFTPGGPKPAPPVSRPGPGSPKPSAVQGSEGPEVAEAAYVSVREGGSGGLLTIEAGEYSASELRAAEHFANKGSDVLLRQPIAHGAEGRTSDLLVDGLEWEVYTPKTSNPKRIVSALAKKNKQAGRIVLDLSESSVKVEELGDLLARLQGVATRSQNRFRAVEVIGR